MTMITPSPPSEVEYQPGDVVRAAIDGHEVTASIVSHSDGGYVVNPTHGPQRKIDSAQILGYAHPAAPAEISGPLSTDEAAELEQLEEVVRQGLKVFKAVGGALIRINNLRLYRHKYATFEEYLEAEWGFSRQRGYELMGAAAVAAALTGPEPQSERQLRPLARKDLTPGQRQEIWNRAHEIAGDDAPSGAQVRQAAEEIAPRPKPAVLHPLLGTSWVWRDQVSFRNRTGALTGVDTEGIATLEGTDRLLPKVLHPSIEELESGSRFFQRGKAVWWYEAETGNLRTGEIIDMRGEHLVLAPTDGGAEAEVLPEDLGAGELPGPPTPFGVCMEVIDGDPCGQPLALRDAIRCPSCADRKLREISAQPAAETAHCSECRTQTPKVLRPGCNTILCDGCAAKYAPPAAAEPAAVETGSLVEFVAEMAGLDTPTLLQRQKDLWLNEGLTARFGLVVDQLKRRRDAGEPLPFCAAHDLYKPCGACEMAAGRDPEVPLADTVACAECGTVVPTATTTTGDRIPKPICEPCFCNFVAKERATPAPGVKTAAQLAMEKADAVTKPGFSQSAEEKVAAKKAAQAATPKPAPVTVAITAKMADQLAEVGGGVVPAINTYVRLAKVTEEHDLDPETGLTLLEQFLTLCSRLGDAPDTVLERWAAQVPQEEAPDA